MTRPSAKRQALKETAVRDWLVIAAQAVLFLKIVLVLLVLDPQAADTFTLPKSAVSHLTAVVLMALVGALLVRDGRGAIIRSPIHIPVAALLISFGLATVFALDQNVALYGAWRRYLGFTQLLDSVALYLATVTLIRTSTDLRRLFTVCTAAAAIVLSYGLLQRAGRDVLSFQQGATPVSTLGQPDTLGGFAGIALGTALSVLLLRWQLLRLPARVGLVIFAIAATGLMFSMSVRNAILAVGAAWLVTVAASYLGPRRSRVVRLLPVVAGALVALAIALSPIGTRLQPTALSSDPAVQTRLEIWQTSLHLIAGRPLLGLGPDNFAAAFPGARSEQSELIAPGELETSTHDWLLYYATSAGLAGALATLAILVLVARNGARLLRRGDAAALALVPLAAYLGQGLVDINDVGIDWIFWVALGVVATNCGQKLSADRRRANWPAAVAVAAVLGVVAVVVGNAEQGRLLASEAQVVSDARVNSNLGLAAVEFSRQATAFDPRRAEYWSGLGTALGTAGSRSAATTAFLDAARIEPWQPIYWRNAGLQRLAAGDEATAFGYFEHAAQLDPHDAKSRDLLARLAMNRGDYARAVDEGEMAARLAPSEPSAYDAPAQAHIALRQWGDAERLLVTALDRVQTPHLHVLLGRVYLATGRAALAESEVSVALGLDPGNAEALQLQAQLKK